MKYIKIFFIILNIILISVLPFSASAHPGRTDSRGGHRDNNNRSGLGSYHYHCGGNPAHLHPGGVCPYGSGSSSSSRNTPAPRRDSISFSNRPSNMHVGDSIALAWTINSTSGNSSVTWSSSDSSVVTVNSNGTLTAIADGTATITATLANGETSFRVTVRSVLARTLTVTNAPERLEVGDSKSISTVIEPENTTDKTIIWSSSDDSVATVNAQGWVLAISSGTVTITATSVGGPKSEFNLEVFEILPERISIMNTLIDLPLYTSDTVYATVFPTDTTNPRLDWISSDNEIASVLDGIIFGNSVGKATITAKCQDVEATVIVNVYEIEPTIITISHEYLQMQLHESLTIEASVLPIDVTYPDLVWSSSNQRIITVSEAGLVKPVDIGNAIITVRCKDISVDIPVEVYIKATGVHFEEDIFISENPIRKGESIPISIAFEPFNAKISDYTVISSDESIAFISDNTLHAVGTGTVTLVINSGELSQSVSIEVKQSTTFVGGWIVGILFVIVSGLSYAVYFMLKKRMMS
jgi:uncharacterized protein YjdB